MNVSSAVSLLGLWPFAQAAMLWWGAAASIPLVIHLLSRRRYRDSSWAAMQFLLAAVKKHARRMRMEQLLLLLARMAILILLAAALAEPMVNYSALTSGPTEAVHTHWVLVFDVSYSMAYTPGDRSLLQQGQDAARELVRQAPQGDGFTLVLMGAPPQVVIRDPAYDPADVLRELDRLEPRHAGANLNAALEEVQELVEQARKRHVRLSQTRVCFFSDLGQTTWDDLESAAARKALGELAEVAQLHLFELGDSAWNNAAVTRLELEDPLVTPGRPARFVAEIRRLSSDQPRQARAIALVDGQVVHESDVDLTSGSETFTFSHRFRSAGEHAMELQLVGNDPLDIDNHRWCPVLVRDSLRALCIEGAPGAARYVALALEPEPLDPPRLRWETAPPTALLDKELSDYECIFLCDVPRFRAEEAEVLRRFVQGGGGLVFFLGPQVQLESYNTEFYPADPQLRLLPARLVEIASGLHNFDPLEYRHPLVQPFRAHERAGLLMVPIQHYIRLGLTTGSARVALALNNGEPILVEQFWGRGRVFLFGSSVSPAPATASTEEVWTDLPVWPSFPPIMQELTTLMLQQRDVRRSAIVGDVLEGSERPGSAGRVLLHDPRGVSEWLEVRRPEPPVEPAWMFGPTIWSGPYRVAESAEAPDAQMYCVNVDTSEGVLDRVDPDSLPAQFERGMSTAETEERLMAQDSQRRSLARPLMASVFGLLLFELYLACSFGSARV